METPYSCAFRSSNSPKTCNLKWASKPWQKIGGRRERKGPWCLAEGGEGSESRLPKLLPLRLYACATPGDALIPPQRVWVCEVSASDSTHGDCRQESLCSMWAGVQFVFTSLSCRESRRINKRLISGSFEQIKEKGAGVEFRERPSSCQENILFPCLREELGYTRLIN